MHIVVRRKKDLCNYWYFPIWRTAAASDLLWICPIGRKEGGKDKSKGKMYEYAVVKLFTGWLDKTTGVLSTHDRVVKETGLGEEEVVLGCSCNRSLSSPMGRSGMVILQGISNWVKGLGLYTTATFIGCMLPLRKGPGAGLSGFLWPRQFL